MIIKNGHVFIEGKEFVDADVTISNGNIVDITSCADICVSSKNDTSHIICADIDASGCYVIPGLVDIHLHGCMGHDFCEGTTQSFDTISQYELSQGVTSICPATMTIDRDELRQVFSTIGKYISLMSGHLGLSDNHSEEQLDSFSEIASTIQGVTMEGPFISEVKKGAQNSKYIKRPDLDFFNEMQKLSGGLIRQVAIAPEEDDNFEFIKAVTSIDNIICSLAHSTADYATATKAFNAGANHVTHLYNGMNSMTHRSPGIPGAAYDNKAVFVELIVDGIHVDPAMVRMTFDMFGSYRICMISDSMEATGLTDGEYSLGGQPVTVTGKKATLHDGTIAGSASTLFDCLKVAVKDIGIPLDDAIRSCTYTPAKSLGLDKVCGHISVGMPADVVILDKELNVVHIIKSGRVIK